MKLKLVLCALAAAGFFAHPAQAESEGAPQKGDAFYCDERKLGYWFYCENEKPKDEKKAEQQRPDINAVSKLAMVTKQLDELKARAILNPSPENVSNYIRFQREQLDRASTFADMWQRVLWQTPELDYTLERPVNNLAKREWTRVRKGAREDVMRSLSERYGVFYFYSSSCGACEIAGPIVKGVSDRFAITVKAVSMDGGANASFPDFLIDTGQYSAMGLDGNGQVPALVLYDTQARQPIPIGFGIMAADEIMDRIFALTQTEPGGDF
tara:strand:- start:43635 stop:44438 length:804 start_codon:yes stop_codon:yes gene_type:complete